MSQKYDVGSGGLFVTEELKGLLGRHEYIRTTKGEQKVRDLYIDASKNFDARLLHPFAAACYWGVLEDVIRAVELGFAPELAGSETPFKFGYGTLVVAGAQRVVTVPHGRKHVEVLKFLLHKGCPPDVEDIAGYTALHHATMRMFQPELARLLLEKGANVNHVNIYSEVPIFGTFHAEMTGAIELLVEFGADLDIPNWQGRTPAQTFVHCGPKVTAAMTRALRKRRGEEAPLDEKKCNSCGTTSTTLKQCSKCRITRYCSTECQKKHWPTHKRTCRPFSDDNTVVLKPFYQNIPGMFLASPSDVVRKLHGVEVEPAPLRNERTFHIPTTFPKSVITKVQVPMGDHGVAENSTGDLLIYTKKRDFVCIIRWQDGPTGYDRISQVIRTKGVGGAKAYFAAELKDKNTLMIKISDILAEQPF